MKTNKKALMGMLVAMIMSLSVVGQFANDKESTNVQQLAWGHTWAAQHSKGVDFAINSVYAGTYTTAAGAAVTAGFGCGVITPAAFVCYGGAALCGL